VEILTSLRLIMRVHSKEKVSLRGKHTDLLGVKGEPGVLWSIVGCCIADGNLVPHECGGN
jgi:hypothetical protein